MSDLIKDQKVELSEEAHAAQKVVEALVKAIKNIRIYPRNNPMYTIKLEYLSNLIDIYFQNKERLVLSCGRNNIFYGSESVYENNQTTDNLALLFFKDGVRELTFHNGLKSKEMEEFVIIVSQDYEKDVIDDDIATLLWQRDFEHISYVVDDMFAFDEIDPEASIANLNESKITEPTDLKKAYDDSFQDETHAEPLSIVPLTPEDFKQLLQLLERDEIDKSGKLLNILFEIFKKADGITEIEDIVFFFMKTIEYLITQKRFDLVIEGLTELKKIVAKEDVSQDMKKGAIKIILFASSRKIINIIGEILDSDKKVSKEVFHKFTSLLDRNAISPFVDLLSDLQNIHARRMVIEALVTLGPKDMSLLLPGLNHSKWYVVRNIIYILRKINDKNFVNSVSDTMKHKDIRVKKEVLKTLGELGDDNVTGMLKEYLSDSELSLRTAALKALGQISSESAKKIIMEQISKSSFKDLKFNEKIDFFTILIRWNDSDTFDFLKKVISSTSIFRTVKYYETKACAAFGFGLLHKKEAAPLLKKYENSGNKLLQGHIRNALKELERAR